MGYLNINNQEKINEEMEPLNEDLITFLHNFWTRYIIYGSHEFNLKKFNPLELIATMCYIPYFAYLPAVAFLGIAAMIVKMTLKWNFDFLTFLDRSYFDSRFHIDNKLQSKLLSWAKKHKGARLDLTRDRFQLKDDKMQKLNTHKATAKMGHGFTDTATTYYNIKDGNSLYVIFFTYDSSRIINAKILTFDGANIQMEPIKEWNSVSPDEYRE